MNSTTVDANTDADENKLSVNQQDDMASAQQSGLSSKKPFWQTFLANKLHLTRAQTKRF
jgi:hypothetical protein